MRAMLTLVVLLGLLFGVRAQPVTPPKVPTLNPGDVISITVFGFQSYGGDFEVFDDGTISGPGFGSVAVEGLSLDDAKLKVETALSKSLKDPTVRLLLKSRRRQVVYVLTLGALPEGGISSSIRQAGAVPIMPGMTLRQLVAAITIPGEPDLLEATFNRKNGQRIPVDLMKLVRGDDSQWNGLVEPDDTLTILPRPYIRVWLLGSVKEPGEVRVREGSDIYQTLAQYGGIEGTGDLVEEMSLTVRRGPNASQLPLRPVLGTPAFVLQAGDVVNVQPPEKVRVTVGGDVVSPGTYLLKKGAGVGQAVTEARGLTPVGTLKGVMVMRGEDMFRVDGSGLATGQPDASFEVRGGDFVFVPRNERVVFALGQVNDPGRFLIPDGRSWRASDLFSEARGLNGKGTLRRVTLLRAAQDGKVARTLYNLDEFFKDGDSASNPELQSGDVLFFGEPKGITLSSVSILGQAAFFFDAIFGIQR